MRFIRLTEHLIKVRKVGEELGETFEDILAISMTKNYFQKYFLLENLCIYYIYLNKFIHPNLKIGIFTTEETAQNMGGPLQEE